jgi:tRNA threonylcarbamoyl adenosine modification protein (Sua5/YciO/YrdC/YwlC family)
MSQFFRVHPENPQVRLIAQAVVIIRNGGVIAYPTDSTYALGCHLGDKTALERIRQIRNLDEKHNLTLICRDLSEVSIYARFDTPVFRLLKAHTPGPYTFILRATKEVPRRLMHPKKKTIGLRIPDHKITQALLTGLNEPMITTTLILPENRLAMTDPVEIRKRLEKQLDLVIDGGFCGTDSTTLVDLSGDEPKVLRAGKGDPSAFL